MNKFSNIQKAFTQLYYKVVEEGIDYAGTKAIFNQGFYIKNPRDTNWNLTWRKFPLEYAKMEWDWYLQETNDAREIAKVASIWKNHMDEDGKVFSNYGWQWARNNQYDKVLEKLKQPDNRRAVISIYDGKEIDKYIKDTPCTLTLHFQVIKGELCLTVNMRSNDLYVGFLTDVYCFGQLQKKIAQELELNIGWYYHFASNLHIYHEQLEKSLKKINESQNSLKVIGIGNIFKSKINQGQKVQKITLQRIKDNQQFYGYVTDSYVDKVKKGDLVKNPSFNSNNPNIVLPQNLKDVVDNRRY